MTAIEEALEKATDTKACVIGAGATESAARMFRDLFPGAKRAVVVEDPRTRKVAGARVVDLLKASGVDVSEHVICPDGSWFHATYDKVEEVRDAIRTCTVAASATGAVTATPSANAGRGGRDGTERDQTIPVAVGSGTVNDLVKRSSEELGLRYMVVGTAASMDGYTSFGASITKDGIKQTLACKAPLGCIVDSAVAANAPREMTASGYADLIAKVPAGADWMLADAIGSEAIHPDAWRFVQDPLRDSLANPSGCAAGDEREVRKLCEGLVMSGFAMQAMNSSRPASGTEHQVSHYWDMEDLCFEGRPVSHGFKVGIGTLISTKTLEFLLKRDLSKIDVDAAVARWWTTCADAADTFASVYGNRPDHILRAKSEFAKKYVSPDGLRRELETLKAKWPELSARMRSQLMPFDEVREKLKAVGAPYEPEMVGVTRARFRETYAGVPFMRARYFGLDLVQRLGLMDELMDGLFGLGGIWEVKG